MASGVRSELRRSGHAGLPALRRVRSRSPSALRRVAGAFGLPHQTGGYNVSYLLNLSYMLDCKPCHAFLTTKGMPSAPKVLCRGVGAMLI